MRMRVSSSACERRQKDGDEKKDEHDRPAAAPFEQQKQKRRKEGDVVPAREDGADDIRGVGRVARRTECGGSGEDEKRAAAEPERANEPRERERERIRFGDANRNGLRRLFNGKRRVQVVRQPRVPRSSTARRTLSSSAGTTGSSVIETPRGSLRRTAHAARRGR